jgi:hypothetical protein
MSLGPLHISKSGKYIRKDDHPGKWPAWNVCEMNMSSELHAAYARLFRYSPEMLEMIDTLCNGIEWLIENHPTIMGQADDEAVMEARELIARVKGESY